MTTVTNNHALGTALRPGSAMSALAALFVLTLRQHLRGLKMPVLSLAFLLPAGLAIVGRSLLPANDTPKLEFMLVFILIPHALATLPALVFAAGIIQDEVEGQTLTYLLLRPLPKWALYLIKLTATIVVTSAMVSFFTFLTFAVLHWGADDFATVLGNRALKTIAVFTLAQAAYCSLFSAMSLCTRWAIVVGIGYIAAFEGWLANMPMIIRQITIMYYVRVLVIRWVEFPVATEWAIDMQKAPTTESCVRTLLCICAAAALLGAIMMRREFRMKTPGG
ncbi:MAG: hypothetical protein HY040_27000 [Planctomycetes bacterium]|nr:hypothetical protein [Planctomycetota bacterium]